MESKILTSEDSFNDLALRIFRFQLEHNKPYRQFCRDRGASAPTSWQEILPIPTDAFKIKGLPIFCFLEEEAKTAFLTSGTTKEQRGMHHFKDLRLYETAISRGWQSMPWPSDLPTCVLTPSPQSAPHSSLSHMMGVVAGRHESDYYIGTDGKLQIERLQANLTKPVLLLGTALAFLHWFEAIGDEVLSLPAGSWAMETGGYKGSGRELSKKELYALFTKHLGLPAECIVNEYSMTELSSQFYALGLHAPHVGPAWTRAQVIDPETLQPAERGYLTMVDLANVGSCLAIATQDLAHVAEDGFHLLGRDPNAIARGCSRAADAMLSGEL